VATDELEAPELPEVAREPATPLAEPDATPAEVVGCPVPAEPPPPACAEPPEPPEPPEEEPSGVGTEGSVGLGADGVGTDGSGTEGTDTVGVGTEGTERVGGVTLVEPSA
jgi:hypothetical protein